MIAKKINSLTREKNTLNFKLLTYLVMTMQMASFIEVF